MSCYRCLLEVMASPDAPTRRRRAMTAFDPRPLLATAMDQAGDLIASVRLEQATLPTPCDDYDVNQLIGHMQAVLRRIGVVLSGAPFWSVPVSYTHLTLPTNREG